MSNLENVLSDSYYLLNIPIKYFDSDWNEILSKGYDENYTSYFNNFNVLENCKNDNSEYKEFNFNSIHFLKFNYIIKEDIQGYFIMGPFKCDNSKSEIDIPFKPYKNIKYIKDIFNSLVRDKLKLYNTYNFYISQAIQYLHKNYNKDICMDDVCSYIGLNKSYFCFLFKKETGLTFCSFLNKLRIEMSKKFLYNKDLSIMDVSLSVGYNNHNYYSSLFKKLNNITPLEFRNNYLNEKMPQL